jgi:hypothetical protein
VSEANGYMRLEAEYPNQTAGLDAPRR